MSAKILLIEDDPRFLELMLPALKERGIEVTQARDGRAATQLLDQGSFDVAPTGSDAVAAELLALQREYAAGLPAKVAELAEAVERAHQRQADPLLLGEARTLAHQLRGTAGSSGFHGVGASAGLIEDALMGLVAGKAPRDVWNTLRGALAEAVRQAGPAPRPPPP
jgi:CheY-like chemotaxis protein